MVYVCLPCCLFVMCTCGCICVYRTYTPLKLKARLNEWKEKINKTYKMINHECSNNREKSFGLKERE